MSKDIQYISKGTCYLSNERASKRKNQLEKLGYVLERETSKVLTYKLY